MQDFVVGIALGMGLVAGLDPLLNALKDFRTLKQPVVDLLQMGTYHISVLVWLYFASAREASTSIADVPALLRARKSAVDLAEVIRP